MKQALPISIGLCAVLLTCGCQIQRTVVLDQAASTSVAANGAALNPPQPPRVLSPCTAPAGTGPFEHLGQPVNKVTIVTPPKALADHVRGCAGVKFRIDPDGTPQDVAVLTEYPLGYEFARTAEQAVTEFRWPARDDRAWRYLIVNINVHKAS